MAEQSRSNGGGQLGGELGKLKDAVMSKVGSTAEKQMGSLTERLTDFGSGGGSDAKKAAGAKAGEKVAAGESPIKTALSAGAAGVKEKVSGMFGGKSGGKDGKKLKVTNIIEQIDVGAPIDVVYNQWTQFQDFSGFMKKVEDVDQKEDTEAHLQGAGAVVAPHVEGARSSTRCRTSASCGGPPAKRGRSTARSRSTSSRPTSPACCVVLEYHPQGLFERTGNMWRAQGRRVRLELKHFRRHVMTEALLHPDDVEGWRGEIHDEEVEVSDEDGRKREQDAGDSEEQSGDDSTRSGSKRRRVLERSSTAARSATAARRSARDAQHSNGARVTGGGRTRDDHGDP